MTTHYDAGAPTNCSLQDTDQRSSGFCRTASAWIQKVAHIPDEPSRDPYPRSVDWAGWAVFGFGATVALTAIMSAVQMAGWSRMDMPMMLGTMFVEDPDRARVVGFFVHMMNGYIFALLYAGAFAALGRATWWLGAGFGAFHGIAALTIVMAMMPGMHPRMASERSGTSLTQTLEPPGFLGLNYGSRVPLVTLLAHVVYGALLGGFLQPS